MPAGSVVVELLARTGSFDTDINRSTKAAEKRMKEMQRTVEAVGTATGIAMAAAGVAALAFAKQTINGLDALNDVSDATGASIENISALEDTALRTGNSFESVSGALVKFNQQLKDTDPANKTSQIIQSIGLDADRLRQIDPAEALHQVAVALARFADDGDKARVVQELFGKSVREVAPLLKDLAEQEQLHATVTTDEAKAAEEFNKQLAQMHKNSTDLARSIAGDLLPQVNALLRAYREGGVLGFLGVGGDAANDPGPALAKINDELTTMRKLRAELDPGKSAANRVNEFVFGDAADLDRQIKALEAQQKYLKSLQQSAAAFGGDTSDALSRRLGDRPGIGAVPLRAKKEPKGKDPDADFNTYLNNLEQQVQKVGELTASEKLLDDIRRGHLTLTPGQEQQLKVLAQTVDKQKERVELTKLGREQAIAEGDAVTKANEAYQERLKALTDAGPAAQLERQRTDMLLLADAFNRGAINADQFNDAATGALGLNVRSFDDLNFQLTESQNLLMEMGSSGLRAFEDLATSTGSFSSVLKSLLLDIAHMIFQLTVAQPLMAELRGAIGGGVMPPNPDAGFSWGNLFSTAAQAFAGARAGGGDVMAGRSYLVGESGPERFVPRTAGAIVPNQGAGGMNVSVINQTTGRVDNVQQQRLSPGDMVLILQETRNTVAGDLRDPNSGISRALGRNTTANRKRS